MKKLSLAVFAVLLLGLPTNARKLAEHVFIIAPDGWGAYSLEKANMPNVKAQMERGAWTDAKRSVYPSSSAPNWASMFMGAGTELHCYTQWGSRKPEFQARTVGRNGMFPTIFQIARDKYPDAEIGCIYDWIGIKYLVDTLSLSYHEQTPDFEKYPGEICKMAAKYIKEKKPLLAAFCLDEPDHTGHAVGHDAPGYYSTLARIDSYIGQIIDAIKEAGIYDKSVIIITSDHGGIGTNHGGRTMQEMETPFIIAGKGIKKMGKFNESMMQYDVAATVAAILDLKQPQVWTGRPMKQVFKR